MRKLLPQVSLPAAERGRTKILFLLNKFPTRAVIDNVAELIEPLGRRKDIQLLLVPHIRTGHQVAMFRGNSKVKASVAPTDAPTPVLIDWADAILFRGTSVIYDAIQQAKPVIFLDYIANEASIFRERVEGWRAKNLQSLLSLLDRVMQGKDFTGYSPKERQALISEFIQSDQDDVLGAYCKFLRELLDETAGPAPAGQADELSD